MKAFSERNPVVIAVAGLTTLVLVCVLTFFSADLPFIGDGPTYSAQFSEAAGLKSGDDVLVAGVKVGSVRSVGLQGTHVLVQFRVKDAWLGNRSTAAIKIKTLLGQKFLAIDPLGTAKLSTSQTIPLSRTTSPFDVTEAFNGLSTRIGAINTKQLASSFQSISAAFAHTPAVVRSTLTGLTALSQTISSRDAALQQLVDNTKQVTQALADDDPQIKALIVDGNLLLTELQARSSAITALLNGTVSLSKQLDGLVADDGKILGPALANLDKVTTVLQQNQSNLQNALRLIGPYYRLLSNALGNGKWLDTYLCGLFTASGAPQLNATAQRNCAPLAPTGGG